MIINVTREAGEFLWKVHPTEDDGSPIVRNGNDVPFRPGSCAHGVVWDRVGELIASYSNGAPVSVVYRDDNSLTARVARSPAKRFTVDLPHRVYRWIGTPWCDTCKAEAVWQEHPLRWAHATEEYRSGVPEARDDSGHEVTVREWNAT